jgi:hypothetical protein
VPNYDDWYEREKYGMVSGSFFGYGAEIVEKLNICALGMVKQK